MNNTSSQSFEQALAELESLVKNMDSGELSLEASLQAFEKGVGLIRQCQNQLQQAELKVQQLLESEDGLSLTEFSNGAEAQINNDELFWFFAAIAATGYAFYYPCTAATKQPVYWGRLLATCTLKRS